jgi:hypothetical protein
MVKNPLNPGPHESHYDGHQWYSNSQDVELNGTRWWRRSLVGTAAILVAPFVELSLELLQFDSIASFLFFPLDALLFLFQLRTNKSFMYNRFQMDSPRKPQVRMA